ncbi:MAG: hypothetical protein ABIM89_11220 [Mycobacteriales bacterium]
MFTAEFIAAEVAYRTEKLRADYPHGVRRPKRSLRALLTVPARRHSHQVHVRTLASR